MGYLKDKHGLVLMGQTPPGTCPKCADVGCDFDCDGCAIYKIISRLHEYEETGLEPAEILDHAAKLRQIEDKAIQDKRLTAMVAAASHAIGLNNSRPYKRAGKLWYRPYRNYYSASPASAAPWEEMQRLGYADRLEDTYLFSMTRAGLDWLGMQLGIQIHDEED